MKYSKFNDYDHYKKQQIITHENKIHYTWFCGWTANYFYRLSSALLDNEMISALCAGSRNGLEPRFFKDAGFKRAIGTDIAPTANIFPYMMQHDFHDIRPSYVKPFHCLYSNSFDHSYSIELFLKACDSFLEENSLMFFDYSPSNNEHTESFGCADCLVISNDELNECVYKYTGYQMIASIPANPVLATAWKHYKDLRHLVFASPVLNKNLIQKQIDIKKIVADSFVENINDKKIRQYLKTMSLYTHEHLDFIIR